MAETRDRQKERWGRGKETVCVGRTVGKRDFVLVKHTFAVCFPVLLCFFFESDSILSPAKTATQKWHSFIIAVARSYNLIKLTLC